MFALLAVSLFCLLTAERLSSGGKRHLRDYFASGMYDSCLFKKSFPELMNMDFLVHSFYCASLRCVVCQASNTHVISEVLETVLILLTSLVHPNHGLDLRRDKNQPLYSHIYTADSKTENADFKCTLTASSLWSFRYCLRSSNFFFCL